MRPEQRESLDHIARVLGIDVSRLVRWMLDEGIFAFESTSKFKKEQVNGKAEPVSQEHG